MIKVFAKNNQILKAKEFALACFQKRKHVYSKRNQHNPKVIIPQIYYSKVFEFAVYNYLFEKLPNYVDIKIPSTDLYDFPDYDADISLTIDGECPQYQNINIKFQQEYSVKKYGLSWMFTKGDTIFQKKPAELMILGAEISGKLNIVSLGYVQQFEKHLSEPVEESQKSSKFALYHNKDSSSFQVDEFTVRRILT